MSIKKILTFFGWPLLVLPAVLPMVILWAGITCNLVAIYSNNNKMPVASPYCADFAEKFEDLGHACTTETVHAKFLIDRYPVGDGILSIGDVLQQQYRNYQVFKRPCLILWGTILGVCLIRKEKFYLE